MPFTTILDKGNMVVLLAWKEGKQHIEQPVLAKCDEKYTGKETLISASIASARSGNERAVNVAKQAGLIKK